MIDVRKPSLRVAALVLPGAEHQSIVASALHAGINRTEDRCEVFRSETALRRYAPDVIAVWGWRLGQVFRRSGYDVLVMERAYLLDRFKYFSLGWNGLNGRALFPEVIDPHRWSTSFAKHCAQWKPETGTRRALVLGQVPTDMACRDISIMAWVDSAYHQLKARGYDVLYRPHPQALDLRRVGWKEHEGTLEEALDWADLAVTYNSNSGVDAVMRGVPVVATDRGSMVYSIASHSVREDPVRPDRTSWGIRMAWKQWLPEEVALPYVWTALRKTITIRYRTLRRHG